MTPIRKNQKERKKTERKKESNNGYKIMSIEVQSKIGAFETTITEEYR